MFLRRLPSYTKTTIESTFVIGRPVGGRPFGTVSKREWADGRVLRLRGKTYRGIGSSEGNLVNRIRFTGTRESSVRFKEWYVSLGRTKFKFRSSGPSKVLCLFDVYIPSKTTRKGYDDTESTLISDPHKSNQQVLSSLVTLVPLEDHCMVLEPVTSVCLTDQEFKTEEGMTHT